MIGADVIQIEVPVEALLPMQDALYWKKINAFNALIANGVKLDPIEVISYPDDEGEKFIALDGHHRARSTQLSGLEAVRANLYISDESFSSYMSRERDHWGIFETRDQFRLAYGERTMSWLASRGITKLADLPEFVTLPHPRRSYDTMRYFVNRAGEKIETPTGYRTS